MRTYPAYIKPWMQFTPTGETRPPKKGEWYLSGAIVEAYQAPNDLSTSYRIAVEAITYDCELTDLYCGEANYSWVHKATFQAPCNASRRMLIMRAKRALEIQGERTVNEDYGGDIRLVFPGQNVVGFIAARQS